MALDRRLQAALDEEQKARARAPETTKFADLLTTLSEAQSDPARHAHLGLIAGTVGDWSRRGYNITAPEILIVLESVAKILGARV